MDSRLLEQIEKVYIHHDSKDSELANRVRSFFSSDKIVDVSDTPFADTKGELSAREFDRSKRHLYITKYQGHFFRRCPGATQKKALTCCNYFVLNLGLQCNMNCSYCYLQSYINSPVMTLYSNIDDAIQELDEMAQNHPNQTYRVGTGEVIDSLSMDDLTLYSRKLIEFFKKYPNWILELKTKSAKVEQFLDCEHAGNITVGWSINPPNIIESEEHGTARFHERLAAARKVKDHGFLVSFHVDPMIYHPNWKDSYAYLVEQITKTFSADEVHVISVGALRFQPEQRHMMRERFGMNSLVTSAEMFASDGGKYRYDSQIRQSMFKFLIDEFKTHSQKSGKTWNTFLCMETPESWIKTYNQMPTQIDSLKPLFKPLPKIKSESLQ